ncbi:MAG: PilZ domain-containing protein [Phycisphaeraceae bacterium]|nr:PilZ domain-containing protein [Phycisphaerales bacterium]MCB9861113.1 PilZ domain-containing protein [Phycisphaeraceae bacterium]
MFENLGQSESIDGIDQQLVNELAQNTSDNIRALRKHERYEITLGLVAQPGQMSCPNQLNVSGHTVDISNGGCMAVFQRPLAVGDVYRVSVDPADGDFPLIFARCVRVRLLREDAFEVGFSFLTRIDVNEAIKGNGGAS